MTLVNNGYAISVDQQFHLILLSHALTLQKVERCHGYQPTTRFHCLTYCRQFIVVRALDSAAGRTRPGKACSRVGIWKGSTKRVKITEDILTICTKNEDITRSFMPVLGMPPVCKLCRGEAEQNIDGEW
jgi:hypothetical protein